VGRLADQLIGAGTTTLFIEVARDNDAARALYEALGFTETGVRKGYYARGAGGAEDALLMRLRL
jgi:ribosomal-protein-alanine N-acetyltransferase